MQNINSDLIRGNIDTIILKTMLGGDMYGLDIIREVENKSNGTYELKQPTLYSCLKRLENQGLISSYWLDSDIGGKRHYYKLTEKGQEVIKSKQNEWSKSKLLIDNLLGDFDSNEYRLVKKDDYDKIINGTPNVVYVNSPASQATQSNDSNGETDTLNNQSENLNGKQALQNSSYEQTQNLNLQEDSSSTSKTNNFADESIENDTAKAFEDEPETKSESNAELSNSTNETVDQNSHNLDYIDLTSPKLKQQNLLDDDFNQNLNGFSLNNFTSQNLNQNSNLADSNLNTQTENNLSKDEILNTNNLSNENNSNSESDLSLENLNNSNIKLEDNPDPFDNEVIFLPKKKSSENQVQNNLNKSSQNSSFSNSFASNLFSLANQKEQEKANSQNKQKDDFVQQNIFENVLMPYQNEVDDKINEFNKNISKLNNFDYSGLDNTDSEELSSTNMRTNQMSANVQNNETISQNQNLNVNNNSVSVSQNFSSSTSSFKTNAGQSNSESSVEGTLPDFLELAEETSDNGQVSYQNSENNEFEAKNEASGANFNDFSSNDDNNIDPNFYSISSSNDNLNELNKLSNSGSVSFENDDGYDSLFEYPKTENTETQAKNESAEQGNSKNQINKNAQNSSNSQELIYEEINNDDTSKFNNEALENIIYKSASDYTNDNSRDYYSNLTVTYPENIDQEYKDKLQNLSEYTKNSTAEAQIKSAKDIQTLKEEYKNEGITIKEFTKTKTPANTKNYLMVNKLNLIKSFILMFGYIFLLSALYIIMNNTSYKDITGFSFVYFIYGFIPFIIYTIYNLVMFFINPYKKVPAKFSPRAMLFISLIFTIQLLLITYCINLQMGFESFTQIGYNHLLWLIPSIVSFAPIVSTLIYGALYRSKNFII